MVSTDTTVCVALPAGASSAREENRSGATGSKWCCGEEVVGEAACGCCGEEVGEPESLRVLGRAAEMGEEHEMGGHGAGFAGGSVKVLSGVETCIVGAPRRLMPQASRRWGQRPSHGVLGGAGNAQAARTPLRPWAGRHAHRGAVHRE